MVKPWPCGGPMWHLGYHSLRSPGSPWYPLLTNHKGWDRWQLPRMRFEPRLVNSYLDVLITIPVTLTGQMGTTSVQAKSTHSLTKAMPLIYLSVYISTFHPIKGTFPKVVTTAEVSPTFMDLFFRLMNEPSSIKPISRYFKLSFSVQRSGPHILSLS